MTKRNNCVIVVVCECYLGISEHICIFSKFILELLTQAVCCLLFACLLNRRVLRRSNRAKVKQLTKELELLAHHIDEPGNILIVLLLYTC